MQELKHMLRGLHNNMLVQQSLSGIIVNAPVHNSSEPGTIEVTKSSQASTSTRSVRRHSNPYPRNRRLRQIMSGWKQGIFCTCASTQLKWFDWKLSSSLWFQGNLRSFQHHSSCPMAQLHDWMHPKRTELDIKVIRLMQSRRLHFALSCGFGHEFGITSSLSCVKVVDNKSPLALAMTMSQDAWWCSSKPQAMTIALLLENLKHSYKEGQASLTDVLQDGRDLVHLLVGIMNAVSRISDNDFHDPTNHFLWSFIIGTLSWSA